MKQRNKETLAERKGILSPSREPISRLLDDSYRRPKAVTIDSSVNDSRQLEQPNKVSAFLPDIYSPPAKRSSLSPRETSNEVSEHKFVPSYGGGVDKMTRSLVPSETAAMKGVPHVKPTEFARQSASSADSGDREGNVGHASRDVQDQQTDTTISPMPQNSASLQRLSRSPSPEWNSQDGSQVSSRRMTPLEQERQGVKTPLQEGFNSEHVQRAVSGSSSQRVASSSSQLQRVTSVSSHASNKSRLGTGDSRGRRTPSHELVHALQRLESTSLEADVDLSETVRSSIVLSRLPVFKSLEKECDQRTDEDLTRIQGLLSVCGPMRGLSSELATDVSRSVVLEHFRHEELCFCEHDDADKYYIILAGHVSVYQGRVDGVPIRRLGPGEGFGELAILHEEARTASVKVQDQMGLVAAGLRREDYLRTLYALHTTTNLYHAGYK